MILYTILKRFSKVNDTISGTVRHIDVAFEGPDLKPYIHPGKHSSIHLHHRTRYLNNKKIKLGRCLEKKLYIYFFVTVGFIFISYAIIWRKMEPGRATKVLNLKVCLVLEGNCHALNRRCLAWQSTIYLDNPVYIYNT